MIKFSLVILVKGTHACYHHLVVTWRGVIIDYESKYTLPLTNDPLSQICGVNTTVDEISCGYGIFPPLYICNSNDNVSVGGWGINEYCIKDSPIRKIFKK
jgi:hypothetical protein